MENDDNTFILKNYGDITFSSGSNMSDYTIDISSLTVDTIDIDSLTITNNTEIDWNNIEININDPVVFEDYMPEVAKVEDMCNDYPALRNAYENFKTIYAMVHQDWQGRQDAEDDWPF